VDEPLHHLRRIDVAQVQAIERCWKRSFNWRSRDREGIALIKTDRFRWLLLALGVVGAFISCCEPTQAAMKLMTNSRVPGFLQIRSSVARGPLASSRTIAVGNSSLQVDFAQGEMDLATPMVLAWVQRAADAVVAYYGRFPVSKARILIVPETRERGVLQGTTWGNRDGFQGFTRMRIGQHTTEHDLAEDWTMTHELVHMGFPDLPDNQHWMEEGLATYIEPVARVQTGELQASQIWQDMMDGMPKGEPAAGDHGMGRTHTWGRTYWGGAMFCLVADVEIRRKTENRKGLQDALRAIVDAGGAIDEEWPLIKSLQIGDKATGTTVLTELYKRWNDQPVNVDLGLLWKELGVRSAHSENKGAELDDTAPLAKIREAITLPRAPR